MYEHSRRLYDDDYVSIFKNYIERDRLGGHRGGRAFDYLEIDYVARFDFGTCVFSLFVDPASALFHKTRYPDPAQPSEPRREKLIKPLAMVLNPNPENRS
jgi:hypothetical protein